jgi:hypothetical protein
LHFTNTLEIGSGSHPRVNKEFMGNFTYFQNCARANLQREEPTCGLLRTSYVIPKEQNTNSWLLLRERFTTCFCVEILHILPQILIIDLQGKHYCSHFLD